MTLEIRKKKSNHFPFSIFHTILLFLLTIFLFLTSFPALAQNDNTVSTRISTRIGDEVKAKNAFEITDIGILLKNSLNVGLIIAAILAFAYLIWGAIDWITSEGDKQKYESSRNKITHALMGLAIMALVWLIWRLTIYFLGIGEITDGKVIFKLGD